LGKVALFSTLGKIDLLGRGIGKLQEARGDGKCGDFKGEKSRGGELFG